MAVTAETEVPTCQAFDRLRRKALPKEGREVETACSPSTVVERRKQRLSIGELGHFRRRREAFERAPE